MNIIDAKIIEGKNFLARKIGNRKTNNASSELIVVLCLMGVAVVLVILFKTFSSKTFTSVETNVDKEITSLFTPPTTPTIK